MTQTESFWDFSVRTYRCQGVPEACLALQNEGGADVNVLLFCCWMGATRGEFKAGTLGSVLAFTRSWSNHVVVPLRGVRTWMKIAGCPDTRMPEQDCMDLRERIKGVEFEAEQLQENVMQSMVEEITPASLSDAQQLGAAILNLRRYCTAQNIEWDRQTQQRLALILREAIPQGAHMIGDALISDPATD